MTGRFSRGRCVAAFAAIVALFLIAPGSARAEPPSPLVARYAEALSASSAPLSPSTREDLAERLLLISSYYRLDPRLLLALVMVESSWRARAVSPVGALGFGQLMPQTAATLDVDPLEPYENLDGTARYLRRFLNAYADRNGETRIRLALASYNAGPAAVARYNGVPPYPETQRYVRSVLLQWRRLAATLDVPTIAELTHLAGAGAAPHRPPARRPRRRIAVRSPIPLRAIVARASVRPGAPVPMVTALPVTVTIATPLPVRWERSRSLVARLLGLRHRVTDPSAPPSPSPSSPSLRATLTL